MSDEIEGRLRQVTPRGAPPELRPRVLAALADELGSVAPPRRSPRPGLAVAAALLFSLALNVLVTHTLDRRLAVVLGPPPVPRQAAEIAAEIASVTDPATGRWAYERLAVGRPRGDHARRYVLRLRQMLRQFTVDLEETAHETPEENPQMDRDYRGSRDRHPADAQRVLRLEHRNTA